MQSLNTLKAVLVDDEADGRDVLNMLLSDFCPEVEVVAACATGKEGVQAILKHHPDLVFMDIDMPGMSGFDVLDCVRDLHLKIVFVTAHNQHALQAFKYSAVDYLLKPVSPQALIEAVQKARQIEFRTETKGQLELLARQLQHREQLPDVIALPMADGLQVVSIADIMYCRADRNYTHIHLCNSQKLLVSRPLKEFDQLLPAHGFFRVHNSALINLKYISKYVRGEGGYLEMKDNAVIEVARARKDEFLNMLQRV